MKHEHNQVTNRDLYLQVHHLVADRSTADDPQEANKALAELLRDNPGAQREYLCYMQDVVSLKWRFNGPHDNHDFEALELSQLVPASHFSFKRIWQGGFLLALAASLLLGLTFAFKPFLWSEIQSAQAGVEKGEPTVLQTEKSLEVATVSALVDAAWHEASSQPEILSRMSVGDRIQLTGGTLELTFDRSVQVSIFGPADFVITSPSSMSCTLGRATALVGENGKGFTIDTPQAQVVDLGTQFGVNISKLGATEVVVFEGEVDLTPNHQQPYHELPTASTRRMRQGDGLMVDASGEMSRLMKVQRGDFISSAAFPAFLPRKPARLIEDVRDNIHANESTKCYQIVHGAFGEDAPSFVDRHHQWNGIDGQGIPEFLLGADYVMPFNDDKYFTDLQVELRISQPAICYVFLDNNMTVPKWILDEFEDTGVDIGLDGAKSIWHPSHTLGVGPGESVDFTFSVWRRDIPTAGNVVLGGVASPKLEERPRGFNMYGIAVAAQ